LIFSLPSGEHYIIYLLNTVGKWEQQLIYTINLSVTSNLNLSPFKYNVVCTVTNITIFNHWLREQSIRALRYLFLQNFSLFHFSSRLFQFFFIFWSSRATLSLSREQAYNLTLIFSSLALIQSTQIIHLDKWSLLRYSFVSQ
jgi:hypothetical protein